MKNNTLDHIAEAQRYLKNADDLLKNNCTIDETKHYSDPKYVKMAGHTVWAGILVALDLVHPKMAKGRKSVDTYREALAKRDRKILSTYNSAYNILHLLMGYDGETNIEIKKTGWDCAKTLINWAKTNAPKENSGTNGLSGTKKTAAKPKTLAKSKTATKNPKK